MSLVSGVSGDFAVQLATRLPDWSAGGPLRSIQWWCPFVRVPCRSPNSTSPTRTTCGHRREDVTRTLRGCYDETASVEFMLY